MKEANATPHTTLLAELMNPNNPKNEREHAAVREIERLQEALAQPEQEPVKCNLCDDSGIGSFGVHSMCICQYAKATPSMTEQEQEPVNDDLASIIAARGMLDAQPVPPRTWVGLTEEEIKTTLSQLYCDLNQIKLAPNDRPQKETVGFLFAKALEAKLKENT